MAVLSAVACGCGRTRRSRAPAVPLDAPGSEPLAQRLGVLCIPPHPLGTIAQDLLNGICGARLRHRRVRIVELRSGRATGVSGRWCGVFDSYLDASRDATDLPVRLLLVGAPPHRLQGAPPIVGHRLLVHLSLRTAAKLRHARVDPAVRDARPHALTEARGLTRAPCLALELAFHVLLMTS